VWRQKSLPPQSSDTNYLILYFRLLFILIGPEAYSSQCQCLHTNPKHTKLQTQTGIGQVSNPLLRDLVERIQEPHDNAQTLLIKKNHNFNPLQTKCSLLYLKTQSVPRCKHFSSRLLKPISLCCKWHKSLFVLR
jgi:hypothetical protein